MDVAPQCSSEACNVDPHMWRSRSAAVQRTVEGALPTVKRTLYSYVRTAIAALQHCLCLLKRLPYFFRLELVMATAQRIKLIIDTDPGIGEEALVEAVCEAPGTPLRAPTADAGLAPFCRDSFAGKVRGACSWCVCQAELESLR